MCLLCIAAMEVNFCRLCSMGGTLSGRAGKVTVDYKVIENARWCQRRRNLRRAMKDNDDDLKVIRGSEG